MHHQGEAAPVFVVEAENDHLGADFQQLKTVELSEPCDPDGQMLELT